MKTLILYTTKRGATREIAERIAKNTNGETVDLKQNSNPDISGYDCIIIGSPVYVGGIQKEVKEFLSKNEDIIKSKKIGLFLCGMQESSVKECFENNFSAEILSMSKATAFLGGIFDPKKAGFFERFVMKTVAKQSDYISTVDDEKIKQFTESLKA